MLTIAHSIETLAMCIAVWHTLLLAALGHTAILSFVSAVALAHTIRTCSAAAAIFRARAEFTCIVTPLIITLTFPSSTALAMPRAAGIALSPCGWLRAF